MHVTHQPQVAWVVHVEKKIIKRFLHKSTDEAWLTKFTCKLGMEILLADKVHKQEPQREMWLYV